MGKTNLRYQVLGAIGTSFQEGTKKREVKKEVGKDMDWRIYSYRQKDDVVDTAKSLLGYLKVNYPDVKMAYQIKGEMVQEFLGSKQVRKSSWEHYRDRLQKLEHILNNKFHIGLDWGLGEAKAINLVTEKLRVVEMDENELKEAIRYKEDFGRPCKSLDALKLCEMFGLRSNEPRRLVASNVDLLNNELTVYGKGGRRRVIPIKEEDKAFLESLIRGKKPNEKICDITGKAINKYLHEGLSACGYDEKYNDAKTGVHAIRKMVAQREYDARRNNGESQEQALAWVNLYLGHSEDRTSLNAVYVAHIW